MDNALTDEMICFVAGVDYDGPLMPEERAALIDDIARETRARQAQERREAKRRATYKEARSSKAFRQRLRNYSWERIGRNLSCTAATARRLAGEGALAELGLIDL